MSLVIINGEHHIGANIIAENYNSFGELLPISDEIHWYGSDRLPITCDSSTELLRFMNQSRIQILNPIPNYIVAKIGALESDPFLIVKSVVVPSYQESLPTVGNGISLDNPISAVSGLSSVSTNINRINQSLKMILSTAKGEIPMLPNLGCHLYVALHQTISDETDLESIRQGLFEDIQEQEPRINVLEIEVSFDWDKTVTIRIEYCLKNTNISGALLYNAKVGGDVYV